MTMEWTEVLVLILTHEINLCVMFQKKSCIRYSDSTKKERKIQRKIRWIQRIMHAIIIS